MDEKEIERDNIRRVNQHENFKQPYQAPKLILIDTEEIGTGGTNAPEGTNGQLSAGS